MVVFFYCVDEPVFLGFPPPAPELLDWQQGIPEGIVRFGAIQADSKRTRLFDPIPGEAGLIRQFA